MAENIGLSSYVVQVFALGKPHDALKFDTLPIGDQTIHALLFGYLSDLISDGHDNDDIRTISIRPAPNNKSHLYHEGHRVYGLLSTAE